MGCAAFNRLRTRIAQIYNEDLGELYDELGNFSKMDERKKELGLSYDDEKGYYDDYNSRLNDLVNKLELDVDILNFLYAPDCEGKASSKTCKKLYDLIKEVQSDTVYGYAHAYMTWEQFKELLWNCARKRRQLKWY